MVTLEIEVLCPSYLDVVAVTSSGKTKLFWEVGCRTPGEYGTAFTAESVDRFIEKVKALERCR